MARKYNDRYVLRDKGGQPIPQIWDDEAGDFVPYTGQVTEKHSEEIKNTLNLVLGILNRMNNREIFGTSLEERPEPHLVDVGTTFTLVNETLDTWITNGLSWVEV